MGYLVFFEPVVARARPVEEKEIYFFDVEGSTGFLEILSDYFGGALMGSPQFCCDEWFGLAGG